MKNVFGIVARVVLSVSLGVVLIGTLAIPVRAEEPIKIGVIFSMTGWGAFLGDGEKPGMMAAVEMFNRQGGLNGRKIEVYLEDDQSNPTVAATAATKLIRDKKVAAIIGGSIVESAQSIIPICEREQVMDIPTPPLQIPLKKWIFLVPLDDYGLSDKMVDFTVNELGKKKLAIIRTSDPYGKRGADGVRAHAPKYGATVVMEEVCEAKDTDMTPQMQRIKSAKPDAIIAFTPATPAAVIAKNYQRLGMQDIPVIGGGGVPSKEFPSLAGKIVEDGRWTPFGCLDLFAEQLPPNDPFRKNLFEPVFKVIKEMNGPNKQWDSFMRNGYDSMQILIEALKIAKTDDRAALRDAMEKVKFSGFLGTFSYSATSHEGAAGETFRPILIKDGKYWPYPTKKK
jgi:branched-chain amino acid transport system substrate-binding protein